MRLRSRYTFKVPEKTLEINVSHELLNLVEYSLNVRKSYIYGFTLGQEAAIGLDVSINVPQFKIYIRLTI